MLLTVRTTFLLLLLSLFACGPERDGYTRNGFGYLLHQTENKQPAKIGEQAWASIRIYTQDTTLFRSPRPMPSVIREELPDEEPDLLRDAMAILAPGDSATFFLPMPVDLQAFERFSTVDYLQYDIVVYEISQAGKPPSKTLGNVPTIQWTSPPDSIEQVLVGDEFARQRLEQLRIFINKVKTEDPNLYEDKLGIYEEQLQQSAGPLPPAEAPVSIHYIGCLPDGKVFAETFSRQEAFTFSAGKRQVIQGWEETIAKSGLGKEILVALPPELAYGTLGKPPYIRPETTVFYYLRRVPN